MRSEVGHYSSIVEQLQNRVRHLYAWHTWHVDDIVSDVGADELVVVVVGRLVVDDGSVDIDSRSADLE